VFHFLFLLFSRKTIKTFRARPNKKRKRSADVEMLSRRISKMQKTIETKSGTRTIGDGDEFLHNNLYAINSTFLHTTSGTLDIENNVDQRTSTLGMQDLSFSDFCVFFFFLQKLFHRQDAFRATTSSSIF